MAYDISALMEYKELSLMEASRSALNKLSAIGGEGGFIAIDREGNIELVFNTEGMYRGFASSDSRTGIKTQIYRDSDFIVGT